VPSRRANWWMPFYVGDYLRDTSRLTRDQHGAYTLLLFDYWISGPPSDDDVQLAVIVRATLAEWKRLRPVLVGFFNIVDGKWRQKRLDSEIAKAESLYAKRVDASAAGVAARQGKGKVAKFPR